MEYPLMIDGETAGSLTAKDEGLYIAFTARTKARGELTRLWLHGAAGEMYLGLMSPVGEELRLERRISKRTLGALRQEASYASNRSGEEERERAEEKRAEEELLLDEEETEEPGGTEQEPDNTAQKPDETQSSEDGEDGEDEEDGLI